MDPVMCATINNNTPAANAATSGEHVYPGTALFKRTHNTAAPSPTSYNFGIVGLVPSPASQTTTASYVTGLKPQLQPRHGSAVETD